ncbi:hypothetical protein PENCOP_c008G02815 [Penicillium coprophilum]|uniref:Uncharacterized protein n=1 Tax=Penicillium coprophilum TaxID=36646 RepID=A0A1V6UIP1_9EURO|nr:hypothetical protein PENCOP_c008G02815 [Penicillium coprophilum]
MDKLHELASKIPGGKGQEVVDKGIGAAEKKLGGGGDPAKKLTNAGREQLEKNG